MNTQTGLAGSGADTPAPAPHDGDLEWLSLLDELYALTEAEGFDAVAAIAGTQAWPVHWHALIGRWATRIGARAIQFGAPGSLRQGARLTARQRLCVQLGAHPADGPAISAQSLSVDGFTASQVREFQAFCAHLDSALALKASLDAVQASVVGLYAVIDALPLRIALLDEQLNVLLLNRPLNEWLSRTDRLTLQTRRLCLPSQPTAFDQALHTFVLDPAAIHRHLQLDGVDIQLKKLPCATPPGEHAAGPRFSVLLLIHEHNAPKRLREITTPPAALARQMQAQHGLSDKELALAWNLAEGLSLKQYAGLSGRSLETTRVQLKSVFRKLGIGDQKSIGVVLFDALHAMALQPMGEQLATVVAEHRTHP